MRLRELASLLQTHPNASRRTYGFGMRLLREATMADAADAEAAASAMNNPSSATDAELKRAAGDGFKTIVNVLIGRVFDGSADWTDVRGQLDTVFESLDSLLAGASSDEAGLTEGYVAPALRRRARKLAESIKSDAPESNGSYIPTGKRFAASIRGQ